MGSFDASLSAYDLLRGRRCCRGGSRAAALDITGLTNLEDEEIFSYRVAAYSYRTVVEHAVVVRIFTLVSSSAPIVKRSMKC